MIECGGILLSQLVLFLVDGRRIWMRERTDKADHVGNGPSRLGQLPDRITPRAKQARHRQHRGQLGAVLVLGDYDCR